MARVLLSYAYGRLDPRTDRSVDLYAPGHERADTSGDQTNYWREISSRWNGKEDLILIEQDNEIGPDTIPSLEECEYDWCTFSYQGLFGILEQSLGCTKFSAALQRRFPKETIAGPGMLWHLIDLRIGKLFGMHGLKCHVHGEIPHHHDYVTDPLQQRLVINNDDGSFTVKERQPDGSWKVL